MFYIGDVCEKYSSAFQAAGLGARRHVLRDGQQSPIPVVTVFAIQEQMRGAASASGFLRDFELQVRAEQRVYI